MAIDAAHRSSIYRKLVPVLGEEDANIVMSEFPSVEAQELVTKDFLRAELAELEARINDRFRQQTIWMCTLSTTLVGIVALVS